METRTFVKTLEGETAKVAIPATGGGRKILPKGVPVEVTAEEAAFIDAMTGAVFEGKRKPEPKPSYNKYEEVKASGRRDTKKA